MLYSDFSLDIGAKEKGRGVIVGTKSVAYRRWPNFHKHLQISTDAHVAQPCWRPNRQQLKRGVSCCLLVHNRQVHVRAACINESSSLYPCTLSRAQSEQVICPWHTCTYSTYGKCPGSDGVSFVGNVLHETSKWLEALSRLFNGMANWKMSKGKHLCHTNEISSSYVSADS